jgi:GNAT superfamily N-acetyltransferase
MTESGAAPDLVIRTLSPDEITDAAPALAAILLDCVADGASVDFMADLTLAQAMAFWRGVAVQARVDGRRFLVAEDEAGPVGTVQVVPSRAGNQPHQAGISKMLVHRRARNRGAGSGLMRAAEAAARAMGKTLLVLDTATGDEGERLYDRLGWIRVGVIPDYSLYPDGRLGDCTLYYQAL